MGNKTKVALVATALLIAFATGRYTVPTKTVTETKTLEIENLHSQTQTDTERNKHKDITVVEVEKPDGTKEKTTHTVEDTQTASERFATSTKSTQISAEEKKTVETSGGKVTLNALAGVPLTGVHTSVYGASVTKEVLGPISFGVWGLSNGTVGASVGISL